MLGASNDEDSFRVLTWNVLAQGIFSTERAMTFVYIVRLL